MDKLQEELDNVRKDFLKFSSLYSSESNPNIGVRMNNDNGEEEKAPETPCTCRHEGSREVTQSHCSRYTHDSTDCTHSAKNLSIEKFDITHDHCSDSKLSTYYHDQGARIPPDWNNISPGPRR